MEKLNNESDVSREISENEIKIVFKNANYEIVSIHRREIDDIKLAFGKTVLYIMDLLKTYNENITAIIYVNNVLYAMVEKIGSKSYKVTR